MQKWLHFHAFAEKLQCLILSTYGDIDGYAAHIYFLRTWGITCISSVDLLKYFIDFLTLRKYKWKNKSSKQWVIIFLWVCWN